MTLVNIMIADDHSLMREGLKQLLEKEKNFRVIAEADNGINCLEILSETNPDVLLLDIDMPDKNGFDVLRELNLNSDRKTKILILTGHKNPEYFLKAYEIGIDGYLLKDSNFVELKKAILSIIESDKYIPIEFLSLVQNTDSGIESDYYKIQSLTKRELDILKNLAIGMYNKEIAMKLNISERTVKNHVSNIFKKISVSDRTQAAVFAIRNLLIDIYN